MIVTAQPPAGFPGERFTFELEEARSAGAETVWSGGGDPPTGTGESFSTVFDHGSTYVVTAQRAEDHGEVAVAVCPVEAWIEGARTFYGPAIDFSRVRIGSSRLVLGPSGTAWTCNDVIRFKRSRTVLDVPHEATLIHELGHVWEHQTGQAQLLRGALEQIGRRFGRDPYDFGGPEGVRRATSLTTFSKESQAQILTELWKSKHDYASDHKGVPFSTPGYVEDLQRLATDAGIGAAQIGRRGAWGVLDRAVARFVNLLMGRVAWAPSANGRTEPDVMPPS